MSFTGSVMRLLPWQLKGYVQLTPLKRVVNIFLRRRSLLRAAVGIVFTLMVLKTPFLIYRIYERTIEVHFFSVQREIYKNLNMVLKSESTDCTIPLYDPFDESTKPYIFKWRPVTCGRQQPYLTYVDGNGYIRVNQTEVRVMRLKKQSVECSYAEIHRSPNTDDEVTYGTERIIRDSEKLTGPYVKARCRRRSNGKLIYETVHAWVNPLSREQEARVQPSDALRPSVLIFAMESMSRLNFIRQLPRTYALLTETFSATVFTGMVKVGDNTYPNTLTLLTGMAARKKPDIKAADWGDDRANGNFDDLPAVWKNFSENGYVTMFSEDEPYWTAFNYLAKGFIINQPTDYYMRPFWLAMDELRSLWPSDGRCFKNSPHYEFLYNYTREFVEKMRDKRYFAFTFLTGYSHTHINEVQVIDEPFHALLEGLRESGALRNTVVVVLGDHGNRFDDLRTTVIGRVEERMPFLAIALPPALRAARPYLEEGLRSNNATLISWYDVYEVLADIALDNLQPASRVARFGQLGSSLFRAVPARTCPEAGVPYEYCVCIRELPLPTHEAAVWAAGRTLVAHINALLAERARPAGACAPLVLSAVHSAQLLLPNAWVAVPKGFTVEVRVAVRVAPSDALLEGTVERDAWEPLGRVKGEVARINKYGNQSHCLSDRVLRLYCYCADLLPRPPPPPPAPPQRSPPAA